ncbi:MAG TPA: type I methionyl aminopeptidase, partial [Candidatus Dormibacteraeota bacterium]|nr:type I methionyl aminopeptidase [Candidatus Dormibacteraeota bacterium]
MAIHLRSAEELEKMHRAGLVVHEVLQALRKFVRPGMTTMDLEEEARRLIAGKPGKPAFKGYRGYPCVLCTSVNSEIVHGIPSPKRKLKEGDIVSIDFGMEVDGYYGDSAVTVPVGQIKPEVQKLLDVTKESLDRAIDKMRAGNRLGDVGHAVQSLVEQSGFSVVREFVGHG